MCQELALARRYRHIFLQREIEQGLTRHLYLVTTGDDFRACASTCADARADRCSLAAVGNGTDDRSKSRSANRSLRCARAARLAGRFIFSRHHRHHLSIHHNPGQFQT